MNIRSDSSGKQERKYQLPILGMRGVALVQIVQTEKRLIKECFEQHHANTFHNLEEMDKFIGGHKLLNLFKNK